jgi:predicted membrane protein
MKNKNPYLSILLICTALLLLYLWTSYLWLPYLILLISISSLISATIAQKIDQLWMGFARLLNLFVPKILLTLIFFFLLTPIALLARFFRKEDPLMLRNLKESTFKDVDKTFDRESFEKPW